MSPRLVAAEGVPDGAEVIGVPVALGGEIVGDGFGLDAGLLEAVEFEGKVGERARVPIGGRTVVALGVGPIGAVTPAVLRRAAASLVRASWKRSSAATTLAVAFPAQLGGKDGAGRAVAEGVGLAAYRYAGYRAAPDLCRLTEVAIVGASADDVDHAATVVVAVALARDLANEPPGRMTPTAFADRAVEVGRSTGLEVEVIGEEGAAALGLGGLLGVAAGSDEPPCFLRLAYSPPGAHTTVALVGKGITFDSGGLSIKTADGMMSMKSDMSGGADVLAVMSALPALGLPVRVLGFIPLTENLPGPRAIKPGDVLTTRNGRTVEVLNTDAEGRLVLADALALAVEARPDAIVDLATLTGACKVALGAKVAGLMGTDDALADRIRAAADRAGELVWPLPLPSEYRASLDSAVADLKNISGGRFGGALVAGLFLREFVGDVPWAHLDIAGPSVSDDDDPLTGKGGTGFGVRTLLELLASFSPRNVDQ